MGSTGYPARPTPSQESKCYSDILVRTVFFLAFVSDILECDGYEIGAAPFSISAFHDGTDGLTLSWVEVSNVLVDLLILTKACLGKMVVSLKFFQRLN